MPFRIPRDYLTTQVLGRDPTAPEVKEYLTWLRDEIAVAEAWLARNTIPPAKQPKPKE